MVLMQLLAFSVAEGVEELFGCKTNFVLMVRVIFYESWSISVQEIAEVCTIRKSRNQQFSIHDGCMDG